MPGLYQIFKLGLVPVVFGLELLLALRKYQVMQALAIAAVLAGFLFAIYQGMHVAF